MVVVIEPDRAVVHRSLTVDPSGGDVLNTGERDVSPREADPG